MTRLSFLLVAIVPALSLVLLRGAEPDPTQRDLALMQGEWSMVSGTADGQSMPLEFVKQMKRICKGDEVTTTMGGITYFKAKITIDAAKSPKAIDYEMTEGVTKGQKQLGIYEIHGDTFKSCFGKPGASRSTEFTSRAGDGQTLSTWKRATP